MILALTLLLQMMSLNANAKFIATTNANQCVELAPMGSDWHFAKGYTEP